ncbi:hypothetical protein Q5P01_002962 [Channa striata]|uniref:Ig-like domain-containing protein n=1 Tax=Channa striata TaxID=64152 RepID=A0AA88NSJ6_CHASR|nr:hypothetical protein Q5P01_002962 [Channa striata]
MCEDMLTDAHPGTCSIPFRPERHPTHPVRPAAAASVEKTTNSQRGRRWATSQTREQDNGGNMSTVSAPAHLVAVLPLHQSLSDCHMIIHHVTKSDEGVYKCHISSRGESPPGWIYVTEKPTTPPPPTWPAGNLCCTSAAPVSSSPHTTRLLTVVWSISSLCVLAALFALVWLMRRCKRKKPKGRHVEVADDDITYSDIKILHHPQNPARRDGEIPAETQVVYSLLRSSFEPPLESNL